MEMPNYELTSNKITLKDGTVLYQIRALKDITHPTIGSVTNTVKAGALGGFVQSEYNLDQEDPCWIYWPAQVLGNCRISGLNQMGGAVRLSPQGIHGFPGMAFEEMLEAIPEKSIPENKSKRIRKMNRFQLLKRKIEA